MDKQEQVFNLLLKKLSALRATLKSDERKILDSLIISPVDEVQAHSMNVSRISTSRSTARSTAVNDSRANAMKIDPAKATSRSTSRNDTRANSMKIDPAKATSRSTSRNDTRANAMKVDPAKATSRSTSRNDTRANSMEVKIIYNATKGEYQRVQ